MARALFLGRFQPFHLGHLEVVRSLAQNHEAVTLAIGSANVSHSAKNPFTAGERLEMILTSLREAGLEQVMVVPVPDVGRNAVWEAHVSAMVPRFDVLYTNNPLMTRLFAEAGRRVAPAPFHARERFEGSQVRAMIVAGDDTWRKLVPDAVARLVDEVDGAARLRAVTGAADVVVEGRDPQAG